MGGDNFNKSSDDRNSGQEDSLLGIRTTIGQRLDLHLDTLESAVKNLTESMEIMEKIIQALDAGEQSLSIPFPKGLALEGKLIGKYNWSHVADRLVELISSEGVRVKYTKRYTGGCCDGSHKDMFQPFCIYCKKRWVANSGPINLSHLVLQDIR
jgi:hypothetical protein